MGKPNKPSEIPVVYSKNMETAAVCRGRLHDLQDWVSKDYE